MRLPRFTLRDLFWLVLVCALAVGWWVERTRHARTLGEIRQFRDTYLSEVEAAVVRAWYPNSFGVPND